MRKIFKQKAESIKHKAVLGMLLMIFAVKVNAQAPTISYPGGPYTFTVGSGIPTLTPSTTGGPVPNGQTSTLAGSGTTGSANGTGSAASFYEPLGIILDAAGNAYVADYGNNLIRKITPAGVVTTLAGSGAVGSANGTGTAASFYQPAGLGIDASGNIYVADLFNNLIRKVTPAGVVTTFAGNGTAGFADGAAASAEFNEPADVKADAAGNIYVADYVNNRIRMITQAGVVSTVAGSGAYGSADGQGTAATFFAPVGLAFDPTTGNLIISDQNNNMIRVMTPGGAVTTLAGNTTAGFADGTGTAARFNGPRHLAADALGNIYLADFNNNRIRKITQAGVVTTLSGNGTQGAINGIGSSAEFKNPYGVGIDAAGNLYIGDDANALIRKVVTTSFTVAPALPPGLIFNGATGAISGIPAVVSSANSYTATAYNLSGSGTASLSITVNAAPAGSLGQSLNQNYIITQTPRISGITNDSTMAANAGTSTSVQVALQYVDGLGRPVQTLQRQGSPLGYDMISPTAYDPYGREASKYLPYTPQTGTAGSYRPGAVSTDQPAFYTAPPSNSGVGAITFPSATTNFDNSPLNRTVEQGAPGVPWQLTGVSGGGHTVKMVYTVNNSTAFTTDSINGRQAAMYYVTINSDNSRTLHANGYYAANALTVTISKDENWISGRAGTAETYIDIDGQVVLKRVYNYTTTVQVLSTYYVYDDLGKLAFVLPPASGADGAGAISQTTLNNLCYQYQYDALGRPIQKKIPGKGWEYVIYNVMDQPVATQDSLQRVNKQWIFTKYDGKQRPIWTGIWNNGGIAIRRDSLQNALTRITANLYEAPSASGNGYTNAAWPTTNVTATLTLDYFDGYSVPGLPAKYKPTSGISKLTRGLPTVKRTSVLNTMTDQLWDVMYYDDLGRATATYSQHYLHGVVDTNNYDVTATTYSFPNQPTAVTRKHWNNTSTTNPLVTIANTYIYDQVGRKLKTWEQITNGGGTPTTKTLVSKTDFNEIGQTLTKHLHSTVDSVNSTGFLQNVAYTYNERGWLLSSSAPLFAMALYYNTSNHKAYNGNIMYQYWGVPGSLTDSYAYFYDKLNRMFYGYSSSGNHENTGYDLMGNIAWLTRYQAGTGPAIDNLAYTYTGNQLQSVNDQSPNNAGLVSGLTNYTWDGNGNMLIDTNTTNMAQNKTFTYNLLNLPQTVKVAHGALTYTYDALGNKLRKVSVISGTTKTTDYISGIEYDGGTTDTLNFVQTEEGKAAKFGAIYDYNYYLGDNLGNTRVTFGTKTGTAVSYQKDDYYPFGMEINNSLTGTKNEYLYNKKELQEETQEYDYGARFYDPVIARWTTIDPLAELSMGLTPYNYVVNNPVKNIDRFGMEDQPSAVAMAAYVNGTYSNAYTGNTLAYSAGGNITFYGHNYIVDKNTGQKVPGSDHYYSETTFQNQNGWIPLTKPTFLNFVRLKYCPNCSIGKLQNLAGQKFESLFDEYIKKYYVETNFRIRKAGLSDKLKGISGNTIPDYIGIAYTAPGAEVSISSIYDIVAIWELKATNNNIGIGSFGNQIKIQIEAARAAEIPELIIVTTYGVQLTPSLKNFASENNVLITHYWAEYKIINGQMSVNFKPAGP